MIPVVLASVTPQEVEACGADGSAVCLAAFRWTHNELAAKAADWVVVPAPCSAAALKSAIEDYEHQEAPLRDPASDEMSCTDAFAWGEFSNNTAFYDFWFAADDGHWRVLGVNTDPSTLGVPEQVIDELTGHRD